MGPTDNQERHPIAEWIDYREAFYRAIEVAAQKVDAHRGPSGKRFQEAYFGLFDCQGSDPLILGVLDDRTPEPIEQSLQGRCMEEVAAVIRGLSQNKWGCGGAILVPGRPNSPRQHVICFCEQGGTEASDQTVSLIAALALGEISPREASDIALKSDNDIFLSLVTPSPSLV